MGVSGGQIPPDQMHFCNTKCVSGKGVLEFKFLYVFGGGLEAHR